MGSSELFRVRATMVADEFIDKYMPDASGDYVKVYLYLIKNFSGGVDIASAAEALRLSEGDVKRAVKYWEEKGLIVTDGEEDTEPGKRRQGEKNKVSDSLRERYLDAGGKDILDRLGDDAEFGQLLFIVQKYMSKILTEREQEVLAYLYDGLGLSADLIDYLVEYAVETGHKNMRYIEKIGLDWSSLGIGDVSAAKQRTAQFDKARETSSSRRKKKADLKGITRNDDLDDLVRTKLRESLS